MKPLNLIGIPDFLCKLWRMVEDPDTNNLICWSSNGKSFVIKNEMEFWYTLLPAYYKHNNMSSFIRQLNMYGFHKITSLDTKFGNDKVEYQFLHPCFQRNKPALLTNIKRKITHSKQITSTDENKVISDVKYLYGRQSQIDNVLNNLKQENSVLWRELAVLRQKHQTQQQIVNKLIQFLVTIVQPSRIGGLGVKRRYPLMINESPTKKQRKPSTGPTIHELDTVDLNTNETSDIQEETTNIISDKVESPASTSYLNQTKSPSSYLSDSEDILQEPDLFLETPTMEIKSPNTMPAEELFSNPVVPESSENTHSQELQIVNEGENINNQDYGRFLNLAPQDTLLTDLINGNYNENALNSINTSKKDTTTPTITSTSDNMTVATRDPNNTFSRMNSVNENIFHSEDIDNHLSTTQNELDQLKEFLNGCNGIDTSYLRNLFNDVPSYGLTPNQTMRDNILENNIPTTSGSEIAPYDSDVIDINELFDVSFPDLVTTDENTRDDEPLSTPDISNTEPTFPNITKGD